MYELIFLTAIVFSLMEVIRRAFELKEQYIPLGSVIIGLVLAFVTQSALGLSIPETIIEGLVLGLSSCGLLKGVQSTVYITKKIGEKF